MATVYQEVWTGQLIESFKPEIEASFLGKITDYSQYVQSSSGGENQTHCVFPFILFHRYHKKGDESPIGFHNLSESDVTFQLDKLQTEATRVTDDELYAISYDKISVVNRSHSEAILRGKFTKSIHNLAPQSNTAETPILTTTGAVSNGKKQATINDIIDLAGTFSKAGIPDDGQRILVLNAQHVTDILKEEKNFYRDYANVQKATELKSLFYGFNVFLYNNNPFYKASDLTKLAFGTAFDPTKHNVASVAFYAPDMFRAEGRTQMYYAQPDPQYQAAIMSYRHYYLVAPRKQRAIGALVSANA